MTPLEALEYITDMCPTYGHGDKELDTAGEIVRNALSGNEGQSSDSTTENVTDALLKVIGVLKAKAATLTEKRYNMVGLAFDAEDRSMWRAYGISEAIMAITDEIASVRKGEKQNE